MELFHLLHGSGALVATPLPGAGGRYVRNAAGGYTSTFLGALLVDLNLEAGTPVDLRCVCSCPHTHVTIQYP